MAAGDADAAAEVEDWPGLLVLAARERLAAVAWLRAGEAIRSSSDAATARRWRALWVEVASRGHAVTQAYADASDLLDSHGVRAITLKGAPLALSLYGDHTARCSDDVDCFVAPLHRALAGRLLREAGWVVEVGRAPGDETFFRPFRRAGVRLEVHSSLVSERLSHLPVPPAEAGRAFIGGRELWVHRGDLLPAYLAAHLATHFAPPLLWWLDFHALWSALAPAQRDLAIGAARMAGLGGYLKWSVRRSGRVDAVLAGDDAALRSLGIRENGRRDRHQLWRHVALAPAVGAAASAIRAWARPAWVAERGGNVMLDCVRRLGDHWRSLLPVGRAWAPGRRIDAPGPVIDVGARTVTVDGTALLSATREVVAAGGEVTVTLTGWSMAPTLLPGDSLLLGRPERTARRFDIILFEARGAPIVHRVTAVTGRPAAVSRSASAGYVPGGRGADDARWLRTRGDGCLLEDPAVPASAATARVVASRRNGRWTAHELTLRFGVIAVARGIYLAARAQTAQARRAGDPASSETKAASTAAHAGRG